MDEESDRTAWPPPLPTKDRKPAIAIAVASALFILLLVLGVRLAIQISHVRESGKEGIEETGGASVWPSDVREDATAAGDVGSLAQGSEDESAARAKTTEAEQTPAGNDQVEDVTEEVIPRKTSDAQLAESQDAGDDSRDAEQTVGRFFTLKEAVSRNSGAIGADIEPVDLSHAFEGRSDLRKQELVRNGGGSAVTEHAVELGLEWLARNQDRSGLWSLRGPYTDGAPLENERAASALALLAFQGAGHSHQGDLDSKYRSVVRKGWNALRELAGKDGSFLPPQRVASGGMYAHALCSVALNELYGMTRDRDYRHLAAQSLDFSLHAQSPMGGWRYTPESRDSDTSVRRSLRHCGRQTLRKQQWLPLTWRRELESLISRREAKSLTNLRSSSR
ncbi:hypothetical protein Pla123a_43890 [Posidoniimonas polymericola]|uniref:Squalene cyclase C-terminal domain-containing protein n=1 Tax=Posidoniimonas polymericola TaxID=2528002 RepID=A0A5C5XVN7_9BACT|nr:hypothetical protein Pla123a_43890 [Posidoniimonas polymericola]